VAKARLIKLSPKTFIRSRVLAFLGAGRVMVFVISPEGGSEEGSVTRCE
jgi:hypothetical protein